MTDFSVKRDERRQEFYDTVVTHFAHAEGPSISFLIDASISLGLAVISKNEWWIYVELYFDLTTWMVLKEVCPTVLPRFQRERDRISNVAKFAGGLDQVQSCYYDTRRELWNADYSFSPDLTNAMQFYLRIGKEFSNEIVPVVASATSKLVIAAVELADLPFMDEACGPHALKARPQRQAAAVPVFISAFSGLMRRINEEMQ